MARRVQKGDPLQITADEYNRLLRAADAIARNRLPGGGGSGRSYDRAAATVRIVNRSAEMFGIGRAVGFQSPLSDQTNDPVQLARFVRDMTINAYVPAANQHAGQFGITIEPIGMEKTGRVVFDGVAAARVNINNAWHTYADVVTGGQVLTSVPLGSAQILWRMTPEQTGEQWAIVRIGNAVARQYLVKVPSGGIPPRNGKTTGSATCDLHLVSPTGEVIEVTDPSNGYPVEVMVKNISTQAIRESVTDGQPEYLGVRYDRGHWILDPPSYVIVVRPTQRIRAKTWGMARELRYETDGWKATGATHNVYNVTDQTLLTKQHAVGMFHVDAKKYVVISARCCEESSSSSYSDSEPPSETSESISDSEPPSESIESSHSASGSESHSQSTSQSGSQSDSDSESDESSDQSESEPPSETSDSNPPSQSDKSTAIVPASWTPGGYTALFTLEAPEVRFDDVMTVMVSLKDSIIPIDPRYVEVCESDSIAICGAVSNEPYIVGASIIRTDKTFISPAFQKSANSHPPRMAIRLDRDPTDPITITVRLTAIRRGFAGKRFPNRTAEQFEQNERFLQSAYPGAGK